MGLSITESSNSLRNPDTYSFDYPPTLDVKIYFQLQKSLKTYFNNKEKH